MIRREMLVTSIKEAEHQYEMLRSAPGQTEARLIVSCRIATLRNQLRNHDELYGRAAYRQHADVPPTPTPLWMKVSAAVVMVCVIVAAALHGLEALAR